MKKKEHLAQNERGEDMLLYNSVKRNYDKAANMNNACYNCNNRP